MISGMTFRGVCLAVAISMMVFSGAKASDAISSGSGFVIDATGHALTNAHVVKGCSELRLSDDVPAKLVATDEENDLALVQIEDSSRSAVSFRAMPPRLGEDILVMGYPIDGVLSKSVKVTAGNINSLSGVANDSRQIQISAPVQPGNSGGPVLDHQGRVLGVVVSRFDKGFSDAAGFGAQNVNFAIGSYTALSFLSANGVSPTFKPDSDETKSTADIAENAEPSVIHLKCFGSTAAVSPAPSTEVPSTPEQAAIPPSPPARNWEDVAEGYDLPGYDIGLKHDIDFRGCLQACDGNSACAAVTYNLSAKACFLKSDGVYAIKNPQAMSAYKSGAKPYLSDFTALSGVDMAGGDYARVRKTDYVGCFSSCIRQNRCHAFAYIPAKRECWLKDHLSYPTARAGVELGVK